MQPAQINQVAEALVLNKSSLGLDAMPDEQIVRQAADIHAALLVVCEGINADVAAGKPGAVEKALALKWFVDACLNEAKPATVN